MKSGIGVYIGSKEVIAVSVSVSQNVPQLERFAIEPFDETSEQPQTLDKSGKPKKALTREALTVKRALEKIGVPHARAVAAFNPFHLVTRYFEIPSIPLKERDNAIHYEASRYIPFKMAETVVDFVISEGVSKEDKSKILFVALAAAKIDTLRNYVNHLRSASGKVDTIEPVFLALSRAVSLTEKLEKDKTYGFLFLDADGSVNITLSRNGITYLSRDFFLSEDQKANETRFYEELKISIDFVQQKTGSEKIEKIFIAGSGDLPFWSDFLTSVFGKIIIFQPALFPVKQVLPSNILSKLIVPIGLALRNFGVKSPLGRFSLIPPSEREDRPEQMKRVLVYEVVIIVLIFIGLRFFILEPIAFFLQKQSLSAIGPQAQTAPELVTLPISQLQQTQAELKTRVDHLNKFSKERSAFVEKLKRMTKKIPSAIWLQQLTYSPTSNETGVKSKAFILRGQCYTSNPEEDVRTINNLAKTLNEDKAFLEGFRSATVADIRRERYLNRDTTLFQIVVE